MADRHSTEITITGTERHLRALVRKAVREGVAMTPYEEQCIETEFVRLARLQQVAAQEVSHD